MNQIDLKGRVAVVTGGAQGIGLAISQRLLTSGARVVLWDIDEGKLAQAVQLLGGGDKAGGSDSGGGGSDRSVESAVGAGGARSAASAGGVGSGENGENGERRGKVRGECVELTDDAAVAAATAQVLAHEGRIDILVNNAGITGGNAPTWKLEPDMWRRVIEVNLIAPYLTCRHVVPAMLAAGYGRIVNIASVAGKEGNPNASHYSASKAGLIALTKSLAKEVATQGVLVNAITPAVAKTAMFEQMTQAHIDYMLGKIPMGRFLEVEEAAAMVAWLSSEECSFSTGAVFDLTGGRATY